MGVICRCQIRYRCVGWVVVADCAPAESMPKTRTSSSCVGCRLALFLLGFHKFVFLTAITLTLCNEKFNPKFTECHSMCAAARLSLTAASVNSTSWRRWRNLSKCCCEFVSPEPSIYFFKSYWSNTSFAACAEFSCSKSETQDWGVIGFTSSDFKCWASTTVTISCVTPSASFYRWRGGGIKHSERDGNRGNWYPRLMLMRW